MSLSASLHVVRVTPGGGAERAGILPGDEIVSADGHAVHTRFDWGSAATRYEFGRPMRLGIRRDERLLTADLDLRPASWSRWATGEGLGLATARVVQAVSLALGLLVALRRPRDPLARRGAWMLATIGVYAVVLPARISSVWAGLPSIAGALLFFPYASNQAAPAILLDFLLAFPRRRIQSRLMTAAIWLPMLVAIAPDLLYRWQTIYGRDFAAAPGSWALMQSVSAVYLVASAALAVATYRDLSDVNERRRFRIILSGAVIASVGCVPIAVWYYVAAEPLGLFGSPVAAIGAFLLMAIPLSLTYAILRHRLFDLRLIVRMGVQYALARRMLLSIVPVAVAVCAVDFYAHSPQPFGQWLAGHAVWYAAVAVALLVAQGQRRRWLEALDRRFFRERYDANRILRQVAEGLRDGGHIEAAASRVVQQVHLALHPTFVALLSRTGDETRYRLLCGTPPGSGPVTLPAAGRLATLVGLLDAPLDLSPSSTVWMASQLTAEETTALQDASVELVVPVTSTAEPGAAILALGARRSEEPYSREDLDLLRAVARSLGPALDRARESMGIGGFAECDRCGHCGPAAESTCPNDGQPLSRVALPQLLGQRYRLEHRLGRGGMGTVYAAADLALDRAVAVKVVREELLRDPQTAERFHREARTAAAFSHPNVVTIHDFGITAGSRPYLVMERLEGHTLRAELERRGCLPGPEAVAVMADVCAAVAAAHRRQLLHRDLKPENIFLAKGETETRAKILDFGISRAFHSEPGLPAGDAGGSLLVGTPSYMAPEQLRGERAAASWDLWALGLMAFEVLTGRHPFAWMQFGGAASSHPLPHDEAIREAAASLDPRWLPFLLHVLAVDPAQRPSSATEFLSEMMRVASP